MSTKTLVWIGLFVGSTIGSILPYFWGGGVFAYMIWSTIGAVAGIYGGFKLSRMTGGS